MLKSLLAGYAAQPGRYDELLASPHAPRPHWDAFLRALAARGAGGLGDMLYPGTYNGQSLSLFNTLSDDNYYRAFRLVS